MARPREFDNEKVLDALRDVFWQHGYEGASYPDIVKATGLLKGSLYAAFGDKRALYQQALARYDERELADGIKMLGDTGVPAARRLKKLLQGVVDSTGSKRGRWGCLICNAAIEQAPINKQIEASILKSLGRLEAAIDKALKEMPAFARSPKLRREKAVGILAGYFGLRVLVKAGLPKPSIEAAAAEVLRL